jgi:hypothetical protein
MKSPRHYELTNHEWAAIKPMLPNKPRGVPRVNDRPRATPARFSVPLPSRDNPRGDWRGGRARTILYATHRHLALAPPGGVDDRGGRPGARLPVLLLSTGTLRSIRIWIRVGRPSCAAFVKAEKRKVKIVATPSSNGGQKDPAGTGSAMDVWPRRSCIYDTQQHPQPR